MVKIFQSTLQIPNDLFLFIDSPSMLILYKSKNQTWLYGFKLVSFIKVLIKRLLNGKGFLIAKKLNTNNDKEISYRIMLNNNFDTLNNNFRVVNYEKSFLLFKSKNKSIALDRQDFWENISGYHEHLAVDHQKKDVIKRTKWLVEKINEFNPKSVLELGCGSGRNLFFVNQSNPDCKLYGVEINPKAIEAAKSQLGKNFKILSKSIYELNEIESKSIDVVFTSGVLMHIAENKINYIKENILRIAKHGVLHYELHGPSNEFDFHRYPRDYKEVYQDLSNIDYEVFDRSDFRNAGTNSFNHSLLVKAI